MRLKKWLWLFLLPAFLHAQSPNQSLTGTIKYQDGTPFNGYIQVQLTKASVLDICTATPTLVGNSPTKINVINGVVQPTAASFIPTPCLKPSIPYYAQIFKKGNNTATVQDNWYFPVSFNNTIDIGNMVSSNFGGPVVVSVPSPIIAAPSASQTVTQPVGTSFTFNGTVNFNGVTTGLTASQLSATPSQCAGANSFATGIQANGNANCSSPSAGVSTFNGRSGAVAPTTGDYSYSQITGTPTLEYQTMQANGTPLTQQPALNFDSSLSAANGSSVTNVGLPNVGTAGTYTNPTSVTVDAKGRVSSVSTASNPCGSYLGSSCSYLPGGIMMQWGLTSGLTGGAGTLSVSYNVPFSSSVYSLTASTFGPTDRITYVSNVSTSGFVVNNNGSGTEAYWIAIGK